MIGKNIFVILLSLACLCMNGCDKRNEFETSKIIINNDVTKNEKNKIYIRNSNEKMDIKVKNVEELNIKGNEDFVPYMFIDNEIYGYVVKIKENSEQYVEEKLYKLKENNEIERSDIEFNYNGNIYYKDGKVYELDYSKNGISVENKKLTEALKKCHYATENVFLYKYNYDNKNFVLSLEFLGDGSKFFYLYDDENDRVYQYKENLKDVNFSFDSKYGISNSEYIKALDSLIRLDGNFKLYKMIFEGEYFEFKEFIDLSKYTNKKLDCNTDNITIKSINDNEVLIIQYKEIPCISKDYFRNVELVSIDKFNFKTNQFTELMKVDENTHFSAPNFINDLIILDEFDLKEDKIKSKNRYFKVLGNNELKTIYKENIENEGETINTLASVIPNMDKKELLLYKNISEFKKNNDIEFKKNIYKKYILE